MPAVVPNDRINVKAPAPYRKYNTTIANAVAEVRNTSPIETGLFEEEGFLIRAQGGRRYFTGMRTKEWTYT